MVRKNIRVMSMIVSLAACIGLAARGDAVSNPDGMLTASIVADLTAATVDGSLVFGHGMLKWTGGDAVWNGGMTLAMPDNLELTVNVTDPNATLTVNGEVSQAANGTFLKTGPGTLLLTGGGRLGQNAPWATGYWKTAGKTENTFLNKDPYWDDTTGFATNGGYTGFTVSEGTLIFNAPGKTFSIAQMPWVGNRQQASPLMVITNNTTVNSDSGWFTISRGTGLTSNDATPVVRVVDGSSYSVGSMCMGNAQSIGNYYCRSRLEVDRGTMTVSERI